MKQVMSLLWVFSLCACGSNNHAKSPEQHLQNAAMSDALCDIRAAEHLTSMETKIFYDKNIRPEYMMFRSSFERADATKVDLTLFILIKGELPPLNTPIVLTSKNSDMATCQLCVGASSMGGEDPQADKDFRLDSGTVTFTEMGTEVGSQVVGRFGALQLREIVVSDTSEEYQDVAGGSKLCVAKLDVNATVNRYPCFMGSEPGGGSLEEDFPIGSSACGGSDHDKVVSCVPSSDPSAFGTFGDPGELMLKEDCTQEQKRCASVESGDLSAWCM